MAEIVQKNNKAVQEKPDLFVNILEEIRKIIPKEFSEKENKSGVTWFGPKRTRLLKVVETKKGIRIEFNVEVDSNVPGMITYTKEEAKEKHMGTCRWIYTGGDMELVKKLVKQAVERFEPKKRADSKEEKDKEEMRAKKEAEVKKEELKKVENKKEEQKPQTNRKLSPEELAKLQGNNKQEQSKAASK